MIFHTVVRYGKLANRFTCYIRKKFTLQRDNAEKLIASALDEVNKLKTNGLLDINLEKFKAEDRTKQQLMIKDNFYWVNKIQTSFLNSEAIDTVTD